MPTASATVSQKFDNPCLPFITNVSPTETDPHFISGSNICFAPGGGFLERRPGFSSTLEPTATAFTFPVGETIADIRTWRKWGSTFVTMVCTTTSMSAKVYAYRAGVDTGFSNIYTATAVDGLPFSFTVANNTCFMGNRTAADMRAYDATSLVTRKWGITAPSAAPSISTGTSGSVFNIYRSKKYCYTYCNSSIPNESSPSSVSACAGPGTNLNVNVVLVASSDTQVDQIRVYATTDGGSADPEDMREITGSPFTNINQTIVDATLDTALSIRTAPANSRNDPPPGMSGVRYLENSSRIAGFSNGTAYYSGFEEINGNASPYECFPGGVDGNNWPAGNEITGIAEVEDGVILFCPDRLIKVEGDSLDTFRRYVLARRQGARNYQCIATLGGLVVWLDSADTIWMLNGDEIGYDIRPTLSGIDHTQAKLAVHIEGGRRWILLLDGANGILYSYDVDESKWNVPWNVSATAIGSWETALGTYSLLVGLSSNRKLMQMVEGTWNDGGIPYSGFVNTGLSDISPEKAPALRAAYWHLDIRRATDTALSAASVMTDDDPYFGTYVPITTNRVDQPTVTQGTFIKQERYGAAPAIPVARQASVRLDISAADSKFQLYSFTHGFAPFGT